MNEYVNHQTILLLFKHKALLHDSATVPIYLQGLSVLRVKYTAFLHSSLTIYGKMSIRH